jgi:hypothetical protein
VFGTIFKKFANKKKQVSEAVICLLFKNAITIHNCYANNLIKQKMGDSRLSLYQLNKKPAPVEYALQTQG